MSDDSADMPLDAPVRRKVLYWRADGKVESREDDLAREDPLEIRVRGRSFSLTMRTPGQDEELVAGFLLGEGLIRRREDLIRIEPCDRNEQGHIINAVLAPEVAVDFEQYTRHTFASSSCGLCGKASIDAVRRQFPHLESKVEVESGVLLKLPERMGRAQADFHRTGGLHAAALFDAAGRLLVIREDIGRHNAVDKVLGYALLKLQLPLNDLILLVSGRLSFEILQKSLAGGVPILAAVSAPSTLAAEFAQQSGQTLIGFLRDQRMNVYTHPQRVRFEAGSSL
ncbi:MAG: formate dehydrogenase accessory sulfurtransferase FdhD [Phycisphaerales bacterium]|nr:formate dehydrogenase accessory sulfurtransferase FdhD [Phycisphaerales bacterium]